MEVDAIAVRIVEAGSAQLPTVAGRVAHGDERGRTLGFPTANLLLSPDDDLADGVYAAWYIRPGGQRYGAAVSVGRRITFYEHGVRLLEAHLLGFDGDLYDELAVVELVARLRGQRRFSSLDALQAQLHADVDAADGVLRDA